MQEVVGPAVWVSKLSDQGCVLAGPVQSSSNAIAQPDAGGAQDMYHAVPEDPGPEPDPGPGVIRMLVHCHLDDDPAPFLLWPCPSAARLKASSLRQSMKACGRAALAESSPAQAMASLSRAMSSRHALNSCARPSQLQSRGA